MERSLAFAAAASSSAAATMRHAGRRPIAKSPTDHCFDYDEDSVRWYTGGDVSRRVFSSGVHPLPLSNFRLAILLPEQALISLARSFGVEDERWIRETKIGTSTPDYA